MKEKPCKPPCSNYYALLLLPLWPFKVKVYIYPHPFASSEKISDNLREAVKLPFPPQGLVLSPDPVEGALWSWGLWGNAQPGSWR